jgi:hypothetical protein
LTTPRGTDVLVVVRRRSLLRLGALLAAAGLLSMGLGGAAAASGPSGQVFTGSRSVLSAADVARLAADATHRSIIIFKNQLADLHNDGGTDSPPIWAAGGTSASAPETSGTAALVIEAYARTHGGSTVTAGQRATFSVCVTNEGTGTQTAAPTVSVRPAQVSSDTGRVQLSPGDPVYIDGEGRMDYYAQPQTFTVPAGTDNLDGGWSWTKITRLLAARGHTVYTPTLTGPGERAHLASPQIGLGTHIDDIVNVLQFEDLDRVILTANSPAGARRLGGDRPGGPAVDAAPAAADTARAPHRGNPAPPCGRAATTPHVRPVPALAHASFDRYAAHARSAPDWDYYQLDSSHLPQVTDSDNLAAILLELAG